MLEHTNTTMALKFIDSEDQALNIVETPTGLIKVNIVNESGLYSLILKPRKPEAKAFKKWVTSVVLPATEFEGMCAIKSGTESRT